MGDVVPGSAVPMVLLDASPMTRETGGMGFEATELPWPQPGDEVFAEAPDWQMNACLN